MRPSYGGQQHTVYPVTPNAGMFYQRGYKQSQNIRREKNVSIDFLLFRRN